ncbi:MAG TPA: 3-phosphoshikimate 1-carboxyvinyltransferase, partial [Gammaproteobacteria bacterium]|nr:3-phosphoshikimate 1-carboxyvinyltransferase [Gammaproteobacteria bacterium]
MTAAPATIAVTRGAPLRGTIALPGDKSITQRALFCAALAEGDSRIAGALDAADTRATAAALAALGAELDWSGDAVRVHGTGGRWRAPRAPLDLGNSATGLRLLAGAIAGRGIAARLTGDAS